MRIIQSTFTAPHPIPFSLRAFTLPLIDWPRFALMLLAIERRVSTPWSQPPTPPYTWQSAIRGSAEATAALTIALTAFILIGRLVSSVRVVRVK